MTSIGGLQHQKLCRAEEGMKTAELMLAKLIVKRDEEPKPIKFHAIPTVAEAHDAFLNFKKSENSSDTYNICCTALKPFYESYGHMRLKDIELDHGLKFKTEMVEKGFSPNTINTRLGCMTTFWNWVTAPSRQKKFHVLTNPWKEIKRLPPRDRERLLINDEFKLVLAAFSNHIVANWVNDNIELFTLLRLTTMRPSEARHLRWEYIDYEGNRIEFPAEVIKIRKRREITLLDDAKKLLRYRATRLAKVPGNCVTEGYVFFEPGRNATRPDASIQSGKILSGNNLYCRWYHAVEKCIKAGTIQKIKKGCSLVPYTFRHTRITDLVLENHPFAVIMAEAGHLNPKTTMKYIHLAGSIVAESIRKADKKKKKGKQE